MSVQKRRKHDIAFKRNAVLLASEPGNSVTKVANELGINKSLLYRWYNQYFEDPDTVFPGNGNEYLTEEQRRIKELEKRLKDVEEERDILKKAMAIFSRPQK